MKGLDHQITSRTALGHALQVEKEGIKMVHFGLRGTFVPSNPYQMYYSYVGCNSRDEIEFRDEIVDLRVC